MIFEKERLFWSSCGVLELAHCLNNVDFAGRLDDRCWDLNVEVTPSLQSGFESTVLFGQDHGVLEVLVRLGKYLLHGIECFERAYGREIEYLVGTAVWVPSLKTFMSYWAGNESPGGMLSPKGP